VFRMHGKLIAGKRYKTSCAKRRERVADLLNG
jgi:hypothetical protein